MNRDDSEVQKDAKREETTKEVVHTGVALSISDVVSRYGNTNYDAYDGEPSWRNRARGAWRASIGLKFEIIDHL